MQMRRAARLRATGPAAAAVVVAAVLVVAVAGCGGSASGTSTAAGAPAGSSTAGAPAGSSTAATPAGSSTTASAGATTTAPARRRPPRPRLRGAPIGATQRVTTGTSRLAVTVSRVLDPLRDSGAALVPGTRAVGVVVTISNEAGSTYDSTASGDLSVLTTAGPASPLFVKQGICQTQLTDFESLIGVGETHSGCVGFAAARRARIVSVRFSPHARRPGSVVWR